MNDLKRVSPEEANQLLADGYQYVDVRTEAEWAAGHPKGALNIPFLLAGAAGMTPNPSFVADVEKVFAKDARIVVGCKAGGRSLKAGNALLAAGFKDVVDQRAGFDGARDSFGKVTDAGWAEKGLPVEKETAGASYAELKSR